MSTERGYLADPFCLEFEAQVVGSRVLAEGRKGVVLSKTYFYPTGGGQEHDTGTLGPAVVTDVVADQEGNVIHIVDKEISGTVVGRVDRDRRWDFMQHHSGQHLLTQACVRVLNSETVSAHISIDTPSTIDLQFVPVEEKDWNRVEEAANAVVFDDLAIKSYFVTREQISTIPLRRPPKVEENIRVVEIEGYDWSACGGTHCTRTGMIGPIKIVKTERMGDKLRVHFVAGRRAVRHYQECQSILARVSQLLSVGPDQVVATLERNLEQWRGAQKELEQTRTERLEREVRGLVEKADQVGGIRLVKALYRGRTVQDLRTMMASLKNEPLVVAVFGSYDGQKLSLTVGSGKDTRIDAGTLIRKLLAEIGGRGGGDTRLAQGGGTADEAQVSKILDSVSSSVIEITGRKAT